ncbi:hypothetical protein [Hydrogenophaga sp.]|uniref:hypothetical protein n=1 Tax=Hydrogenophaga sp. TaxID=1904254 RepID=UPI00356802DC
MSHKELLSALAMVLTVAGFLPYIRGILKGTVQAHVFSWVIWGTTTLVVFLAQLQAHGGAGAWAIGVSAGITVLIAALAFARRGDLAITRSDWLFFTAAMASLPLWYLNTDPMWAVVLLTVVDITGFGPTLRKAYRFPHAESLGFFALFLLRNLIVILALESYSVTTVLFPAAVALACAGLIGVVWLRRRQLAPLPAAPHTTRSLRDSHTAARR